MSARSCDCVTGGKLCHEPVHESFRVGVPGYGGVWVGLCRTCGKRSGDDALLILAMAKIDRSTQPRSIRSNEIREKVLVQSKDTLALGTIVRLSPSSVRVKFSNGFSLACSKTHLKSNYQFPFIPKHPSP